MPSIDLAYTRHRRVQLCASFSAPRNKDNGQARRNFSGRESGGGLLVSDQEHEEGSNVRNSVSDVSETFCLRSLRSQPPARGHQFFSNFS